MHATVADYTDALPKNLYISSALHYDENYVPCTQYFMGNVEQYALAGAPIETLTIGNNVTELDAGAFQNCTALKKVTVGEDLNTVYQDVFAGDAALTSVKLYGTGTMTRWGRKLDDGSYQSPLSSGNSVTLYYPTDATVYSTTNVLSDKKIALDFKSSETFSITNATLSDAENTKDPTDFLTADDTKNNEYGAQYVTIGRKMTKDKYYTIVLPFDLSKSETEKLGTVYDLRGKTYIDGSTLHIYLTEVTTMQGGVPYLVKWGSNVDNIALGLEFTKEFRTLVDDASEAGGSEDVTFYGTYKKINIPQGDYFISGGKLYKAKDDTNTCGGYRGLLKITDPSKAKLVTGMVYDLNDPTTGIVSIDAKTLRPVTEGYTDLLGRHYNGRPRQKGIYIVNVKKVIVKD